MASGYSDTPLVKKLTLRDGMRVWFDAMPEHIIDEIDEYALELFFVADPAEGIDAAHIFVTERAALEAHLTALRHQICARWSNLGQLAEKGRQSADRHHRRHHPRNLPAAGAGRYQGLRGG